MHVIFETVKSASQMMSAVIPMRNASMFKALENALPEMVSLEKLSKKDAATYSPVSYVQFNMIVPK